MTMKEVLNAMSKGAILCMEFDFENDGKRFWLEPTRTLIDQDIGEKVVAMPFVKPGGDTLFKDTPAQTWKVV